MFKIIKQIGKSWWLIAVMALVVLANVFMDFLLPLQLGSIIGDLQNSAQLANPVAVIAVDCLWMVLIALLSGITAIITCKLSSIATARIISKTRYELFKRISSFSSTEMNKFSVSSLVTRTTNDLTFIGNTLNLFFRYAAYGPLLAVASVIGLSLQDGNMWAMIIAIAGTVILIILFIAVIVKVVLPKYEKIQTKLDKVALVSRENLEGLRVVRAYNAEDYQEEKFEKVNDELMVTERYSNRGLGLLTPGLQLLVGVLNVGIYVIGAYQTQSGDIAFPQISIVVQFAALILTGFIMMIAVMLQLPRTIVCAKRVNEVIDMVPAVIGKETTPETNEVGTIEFRNVTFKYPGAEIPVVSNVSFKVNKGETIAFIGATGSGKTTILNLMLRFFDAVEGEVLIDGINVKDYNLADLNHKFGYVPQKGYLFHDTLVNNLTIGRPNATSVEIERALRISQSAEFVAKMNDGLNYEISQGGKNVSGGQRQRLCIARAIIMDPEIFVFDDSFSALDYRTDKILRGEIKKECAGTTNVIVAQRVGTILEANQIVCLDNGKVMGIGTHQELLENCPVYREIALSQLTAEELGIKEGK